MKVVEALHFVGDSCILREWLLEGSTLDKDRSETEIEPVWRGGEVVRIWRWEEGRIGSVCGWLLVKVRKSAVDVGVRV